MRDYAKVAPTFWTRGSGKALRGHPEAQIVALYLFTAPASNMIGLYHVALPIIAHETGLTLEGASKGLARASEAPSKGLGSPSEAPSKGLGSPSEAPMVAFDEDAELVFLPEAAAYQIGDRLAKGDNRIKGIERELVTIGAHPFTRAFLDRYAAAYNLNRGEIEKALRSPLEAPPKGLGSPLQAPPKPGSGSGSGTRTGAESSRVRAHESATDVDGTGGGQEETFETSLPPSPPSGPESAVKAKPGSKESILEALQTYPSLELVANDGFAGEITGLLLGSGYKPDIVVQAIADAGFDLEAGAPEQRVRRMVRSYIQNAHVRSKSAPTPCPTSDAKDFDQWADRNQVPKLGSKWGHECGRMCDHYAAKAETRANWRAVWNSWIENTSVPKLPGPHPRVARVIEQRRRKEEDAAREVSEASALSGPELAASIRGLIGGRKAANGD